MMTDLDIHLIQHGTAEYEETVALRDTILRKPLGLVFTAEQLGSEAADLHLACYLDGSLVGCLILTAQDASTVKMRQVAVVEALQGWGIGTAMVLRSEQIARDHGYAVMKLNARMAAVPFYERLGYECIGEPFEEVTIPHHTMIKQLAEPG